MMADIWLFIVFFIVLFSLAIPLGKYMASVFAGERSKFEVVFTPLERLCYRLAGVAVCKDKEMDWKAYTTALVVFNLFGLLALFALQMTQHLLPLNPEKFPAVASWHSALNTAISFMTNTNWQGYGGETTMTYLTQMAGLTVQNFLSAATGVVVAVVLMRALTGRSNGSLGNFYRDVVRCTVRILLPLAVVGAVLLMHQGVIQNFNAYVTAYTMEGARQTIAMGPVASQEAIKMIGTNGGGFFNANSAHPFENPTPLSNFLEMIFIFMIPLGLVFTFGHMAENKKQSFALSAAMLILFTGMFGAHYFSEIYGNPMVAALNVAEPTAMEGKEVRFGLGDTALFATVTTAASCGAVNAMHDSLTPFGGLVPMLQMMIGEVIFGGAGAGFYGMMLYVLITVFIVGLMVGRTPEYLGKKIEARQMKLVMMALLLPSCGILLFSAISCVLESGVSSLNNAGPHGLSEIFYAYASAFGNNGSAFAGLTANTLFYDIMLGMAMLIGRFGVIVPVMMLAGSMVEKKATPTGLGTFDTGSLTFAGLLSGVVIIIGALTFLPALSLGPIAEHLFMLEKMTF